MNLYELGWKSTMIKKVECACKNTTLTLLIEMVSIKDSVVSGQHVLSFPAVLGCGIEQTLR